MDAFYHGPGWEPIPTFEDDVAEVVAQDSWVFDSHGYKEVRDLMWSRVDTVVWLSYSRPVVTSRVVRRSFVRARDRQELFNGNTEDFRAWLDPEHPIRWSVTRLRVASRRHARALRRPGVRARAQGTVADPRSAARGGSTSWHPTPAALTVRGRG